MAEWLLRGTVNTLFRGSIPLNTYNIIYDNNNNRKCQFVIINVFKF